MTVAAQAPTGGGAKADDLIPKTFRSYVVADLRTDPKDPTGKRNVTGKLHCLVTESELNPTLAVFSGTAPSADGKLTLLTRSLKQLHTDYKSLDFNAFILFTLLKDEFAFDPNADKTAEDIRLWTESVKPDGLAVALATRGPDDKPTEAMTAWKLSTEGVTVVFYHRHKFIKRWDFASEDAINDAAIEEMQKAVNAELKR
jgi:hypothetical protein